MMRSAARVLALVATLWLAAGRGDAHAASPFADWSAVVVAGDWHAHDGGPTEAFDNARRDVAAALTEAGFDARNVRQFSVRPERYRDTRPAKSELRGIYTTLTELAARNPGGCLFYLTSHGVPQGAQLDQDIVRPNMLAGLLNRACGDRPTIVVISACFSGVFVGPMEKRSRMVLTAARADRTSFGCGQDNKYPYFDDCFLSSSRTANNFVSLGELAKRCVAERERVEKMSPASEPQMRVGGDVLPLLQVMLFRPPG